MVSFRHSAVTGRPGWRREAAGSSTAPSRARRPRARWSSPPRWWPSRALLLLGYAVLELASLDADRLAMGVTTASSSRRTASACCSAPGRLHRGQSWARSPIVLAQLIQLGRGLELPRRRHHLASRSRSRWSRVVVLVGMLPPGEHRRAGRRPDRRALSSACSSSEVRSCSRVRLSSRETCIWETPISSAICDWVMFLKNRSSRIFFSRGVEPVEQRLDRLADLDVLEALVVDADRVEHRRRRRRRCRRWRRGRAWSRRCWTRCPRRSPRPCSRSPRRARAAVGERPRLWVSSAVAAPICIRSSWSRRGTRIAQPLSRK